MIPIVLYTTNRATAAAIRSANGMIPGLRGNDLLLESRQQPLPLSQDQPQIGDLSQIIRPGDRRDVDGLFLTVSAGFHQPHHPSRALTPIRDQTRNYRFDARTPNLQAVPFAKACTELGAQYRHTKPRTPQTNGMVERFNGRIVSEVLAITLYSHDQLEQLLRGFNAAYNARRQRVLDGQTPDQVVAERLTAKPELANAKPSGRAGPCDIIKARRIAESAKEVSQPDS